MTMDKQQLKKAAIYLKCGEYDGTHIMTGWIACNELIKAQDRIAELEAELKSREWVSVEDELPEKDGHYLVLAHDIVNQWQDVRHLKTHHYKRFISDDGFSDYEPIVTHWMPLPSPPESDNNG